MEVNWELPLGIKLKLSFRGFVADMSAYVTFPVSEFNGRLYSKYRWSNVKRLKGQVLIKKNNIGCNCNKIKNTGFFGH